MKRTKTVDYSTNTLGLSAEEAKAYVGKVGGKPETICHHYGADAKQQLREVREAKRAWAGCGVNFKPTRLAVREHVRKGRVIEIAWSEEELEARVANLTRMVAEMAQRVGEIAGRVA